MSKIKSLEELRKLREEVQTRMKLRENSDKSEDLVRIKVAMATCGIASGARETMRVLIEQLDQRGVDAVVTQTGCNGLLLCRTNSGSYPSGERTHGVWRCERRTRPGNYRQICRQSRADRRHYSS